VHIKTHVTADGVAACLDLEAFWKQFPAHAPSLFCTRTAGVIVLSWALPVWDLSSERITELEKVATSM